MQGWLAKAKFSAQNNDSKSPGFAVGYAVAVFVFVQWPKTKTGAGAGIRTRAAIRREDFKSPASTIPPLRQQIKSS